MVRFVLFNISYISISLKYFFYLPSGLPPHGTVLEVECAAVYNSVYVQLLRQSIQDVHTKERRLLSSCVTNCLHRGE